MSAPLTMEVAVRHALTPKAVLHAAVPQASAAMG